MPRNVRVLFVGDSVTAGFGLAGRRRTFNSRPSDCESAGFAIEVVCDACPGPTARNLRRFDRMVAAHDPDWVVLHVGLNDALPPHRRFSPHDLLALRRARTGGIRREPLGIDRPHDDDRRTGRTDDPQPALRVGGGFARERRCPVGGRFRRGRGAAAARSDDVLCRRSPRPGRGLASAAGRCPSGLPRRARPGRVAARRHDPTARGHELMADVATEEFLGLLDYPRLAARFPKTGFQPVPSRCRTFG